MSDPKEDESIRVAVRCRPMNEREIREQARSCFTCENGNAVLTNLDNPSDRYEFGYDHVYDSSTPQEQLFLDIGKPILTRAFGGYNGTIFAYGQTGSGKTFSMTGLPGKDLEGLIPRMNHAMFDRIAEEKKNHPTKLFLVECSYFEIYNEIIYDLLDASNHGNKKSKGTGLEIREHSILGIYIKDLHERVVESSEEVGELMAQGSQARTVGATQMNAESSRSHSIFIIKISQKDAADDSKNVYAKINLVDLAGSERATSTGAQGDRLKEGANINKSLSALGNVINALVEVFRSGKKIFIPYRNSKLTRVLQESLGGNSLCSMLAACSPANINFNETLSTLKYASRAKSIKVNAKKNETSSQISQLNEEIAALRKKLQDQMDMQTLASGTRLSTPVHGEKEEMMQKYEKQIQEMERVRLQTWEDKAKLSKHHQIERNRLAKERELAHQRMEQERAQKWILLREKDDLELAFRSVRDLEVHHKHDNEAGDLSSLVSFCDSVKWLEHAQRLKQMEADLKDHRTLILVFKDSFDKDIDAWAKQENSGGLKDSNTSQSVHEVAAIHMTWSHIYTKLQNIDTESAQLFRMESEWMHAITDLKNALLSALVDLKRVRDGQLKRTMTSEQRSETKRLAASNSSALAEQFLQEMQKGLVITYAILELYQQRSTDCIQKEHAKLFAFKRIVGELERVLQERGSFVPVDDKGLGDVSLAQELTLAVRTFEDHQSAHDGHSSVGHRELSYLTEGDVFALGKYHCKFEVGNNTHEKIMDFELPHMFCSIAILWNDDMNGSDSGLRYNESLDSDGSRPNSSLDNRPIITFKLAPHDELQNALQKYLAVGITGDTDQVYAILGWAMSWTDLLKTSAIPNKLFSRPPVRFLHDIIRLVTHSTGYAASLLTESEKDYTNLRGKIERAEFLNKILHHVQETYNHPRWNRNVIIAATASNILTGKEARDTLQFLEYFGLAALEYAVDHPQKTEIEKAAENLAGPGKDASSANELVELEKMPCDVRVHSSQKGTSWHLISSFETTKNCDVKHSIVPSDGNSSEICPPYVGRYIKLNVSNMFCSCHVQIFGARVVETKRMAQETENAAICIANYIGSLVKISSIIVHNLKALLDRAKQYEQDKLREQTHLTLQVATLLTREETLKHENLSLVLHVNELQTNLDQAKQEKQAESISADRKTQEHANEVRILQSRLQTLESTCSEHVQHIDGLNHQLAALNREIRDLRETKLDMEELCLRLRGQIQSRENGSVASGEDRVAAIEAELMSTNVLVVQLRRNIQAAEESKKDHELIQAKFEANIDELRKELFATRNGINDQSAKKQNESNELLVAAQQEMTFYKDKAQLLETEQISLQKEVEKVRRQFEQELQARHTLPIHAESEAEAREKMLMEAETKELRLLADIDKLETKLQAANATNQEQIIKFQDLKFDQEQLLSRLKKSENMEEELVLQIQVLTEERDAARQKEEQLFSENNEKDQEIERIRDGYVWVTDRMNLKEDELVELHEQLEQYRSLLASARHAE